MAGFWQDQKNYWNQERSVPGNPGRTMRLWVFEVGYVLAWYLVLLLVWISPAGKETGVDALPLMFVTFGAVAGAYMTGGFGFAYLLDRVFRQKPEPEVEAE